VDSVPRVPAILEKVDRVARCRVPTQRVPGLKADPWVLTLPDGAGYVAWCQNETRDAFDILVALATRRHVWAACPARITVHEAETLPEFSVRQLRSSAQAPYLLREFAPFDRNGSVGPSVRDKGQVGGLWAIEWADDLNANRVICHRGRWLIAGSH
jgi:hypothetical protein